MKIRENYKVFVFHVLYSARSASVSINSAKSQPIVIKNDQSKGKHVVSSNIMGILHGNASHYYMFAKVNNKVNTQY